MPNPSLASQADIARATFGIPVGLPPGAIGAYVMYDTLTGAPVAAYVNGVRVTASGAPAYAPTTYAVDGVIAHIDGTAKITKGSAAAMTITDPTTAEEGMVIRIMSQTAFAHTVTYSTTGFNGGSTASDVATFGGAVGDNFQIQAINGKWNVCYLRNVTLG